MVYDTGKNKGTKRSDTETPLELCDMIYNIITEHYKPNCILDTSCGDSRLTKKFDCKKIEYEIKQGKDFLLETKKLDEVDLVIQNPPFNIGRGKKLAVEIFMDKVLELCNNNIPIVLITPMGFRLNQRYNSKRWKKLKNEYPPITNIISLPIDTYENTLFHSEVLIFNLPNADPHYFIDY